MDWEDKLSVGIPEFDNEHKKLIDMINNLHTAMKERKSKDVLASLIKDLKNYTQEHFSQEETFMKKYDYADFAAHEIAHKKFIEQINGVEKDFEADKLTVAIDLFNFLTNWLKVHIKDIDKKYGDALAGKEL